MGVQIADDTVRSTSAEIIRKQASPVDIRIDGFQKLVDRFLLSAIQRWLWHVIIYIPQNLKKQQQHGDRHCNSKISKSESISDWILPL